MFIHTFESVASINTNLKELQKEIKQNSPPNTWKETQNGMVSWTLSEFGIKIETQFCFKTSATIAYVRYIINPQKVFNHQNSLDLFDTKFIPYLLPIINQRLKKLSPMLPSLEETSLSRIDFTFQVKFQNEIIAEEYIRTVKRGRTPAGFRLEKYYNKKEKRWKSFGDSYTIISDDYLAVSIYNKGKQMQNNPKYFSPSEIERGKGVVRFEIRCDRGKIKALRKKYCIEHIIEFFKSADIIGADLFSFYLQKPMGKGEVLILNEARRKIKSLYHISESNRELLLELIEASNLYRNADDAIEMMAKKYGIKKTKTILRMFDDNNLSFVTLTKSAKQLFSNFPQPYHQFLHFLKSI